jgi:hypothetical protein
MMINLTGFEVLNISVFKDLFNTEIIRFAAIDF